MIRDVEFTDERIADSIKQDLIGRNYDLEQFIRSINSIQFNTYITVDAGWGAGKTIFVKQMGYLNYCKEEFLDGLTIDRGTIDVFRKKYVLYHYNAWANDQSTDPLASILFNMINDFYSFPHWADKVSKQLLNSFKTTGQQAIKIISAGLFDVEKMLDVDTIDKFLKQVQSIQEKRDAISKIIGAILDNDKRLIIVIDELDRCSPTYAVKLLEVIKHFYSDDRIVFVLSTNNRQLAHTVKKFYGDEFDAYGYLDKFYDFVYNLRPIDMNDYVQKVLNKQDNSRFFNTIAREFVTYLGLSLRQTNRYYSLLEVARTHADNARYDEENLTSSLTNYVFIPFAFALRVKNMNDFDNFRSGAAKLMVEKLYDDIPVVQRTVERYTQEMADGKSALLAAYSDVMNYKRIADPNKNYDAMRAGEKFDEILPLMPLGGELDRQE